MEIFRAVETVFTQPPLFGIVRILTVPTASYFETTLIAKRDVATSPVIPEVLPSLRKRESIIARLKAFPTPGALEISIGNSLPHQFPFPFVLLEFSGLPLVAAKIFSNANTWVVQTYQVSPKRIKTLPLALAAVRRRDMHVG